MRNDIRKPPFCGTALLQALAWLCVNSGVAGVGLAQESGDCQAAEASAEINAPSDVVFETIVDVASYPDRSPSG